MKFAVIRLAILSRQQTSCRIIAVASRVVHGTLHSPPCFGMEPPLRWRPDSRRMRSLTDRRLYKIAHPGFATIKVAPTAQVVSARRMAAFGTGPTSRDVRFHREYWRVTGPQQSRGPLIEPSYDHPLPQQIAPARPSHCSQQSSSDFCIKIGADQMRLTDRRAKLSQNMD